MPDAPRSTRRPFAAARGAAAALALWAAVAGCRNASTEMYDQPRYEAYEATSFFPDGLSSRPLVEGTIPRVEATRDGLPADLHAYQTGRDASGAFLDQMPFPADRAVLDRGNDRYKIFCAPCHGLNGAGRGPIVLRGFSPPPRLYDTAVANQPLGYYFDVITNGHGAMYGYAARIPVRDRWTIAAFLRALQLSRSADPAALDDSDRAELTRSAASAPAPAAPSEAEAH
jgi:mono/diheme cytochrome c family protein